MRAYNLTEQEKELLKALAKSPATYYDLYLKQKVGSSSFVWKTLKNLAQMGYIEVKKEVPFDKIKGKSKRYWGLTFKGLLACLKYGVVKPANALKIEKVNQIKVPCKTTNTCSNRKYFGDVCPRIVDFKQEYPEVFYEILSRLANPELKDIAFADVCCTATMLGAAWLYLNNLGFREKCITQGELVCGCWSIATDDFAGEPLGLLGFFESFLKALGLETKGVADLPDD